MVRAIADGDLRNQILAWLDRITKARDASETLARRQRSRISAGIAILSGQSLNLAEG